MNSFARACLWCATNSSRVSDCGTAAQHPHRRPGPAAAPATPPLLHICFEEVISIRSALTNLRSRRRTKMISVRFAKFPCKARILPGCFGFITVAPKTWRTRHEAISLIRDRSFSSGLAAHAAWMLPVLSLTVAQAQDDKTANAPFEPEACSLHVTPAPANVADDPDLAPGVPELLIFSSTRIPVHSGTLPQPKPQEILTDLQNQTKVDMSGVTTTEQTLTVDGRTIKLFIMKPDHIEGHPGVIFRRRRRLDRRQLREPQAARARSCR